MAQKKLDILIVGGGIAGPTLVYWLHRATPCTITVIERAPAARTSGQAVDMRGIAVDILQQMSLIPAIRAKHTTETGMRVVNSAGSVVAEFPATGDAGQQSITSEFEILRGDLAQILLDKAADCAEYVYDESVASVEEGEEGVRVEFANGHLPPKTYDLVVAADGLLSRTRRAVFGRGPDDADYLHRLGQYVAFFTIAKDEQLDSSFAEWWSAGRGRVVIKRPSMYNDTRVFLGVTDKDPKRLAKFEAAVRGGREAQMAVMKEEFQDAEWDQTGRFLEGMERADDFYYAVVAQTKMEEFVRGRVALLGDAGYCPSPISGMGTSTAIVGAYVLAGSIAASPNDIPNALRTYQATLRPFIEEVQTLIPGAPQIVNPQSALGVSILNGVAAFASQRWLVGLAGWVGEWLGPAFARKKWAPPEYVWMDEEGGGEQSGGGSGGVN